MIDYSDYLQTPHWKSVRADALKRAGHRCQVCNRKGRLEVHHRTYDRRGRELPADLIAICDNCHGTFHSHGLLWRTGGPSRELVALVRRQMAEAV